jgi:uncharacterized membrane-anchored protein YhcB (DUF1043 family)
MSTIKRHYLKLFTAFCAIVIVAWLLSPSQAAAVELGCSLDPTTWIPCAVYGITYIVTTIMSYFVALGAWLTTIALGFNHDVYNMPAVQTGFSVSLALANLGFVLGIIVIALATIIRSQTYGMKQLLWKLVLMAIIVNFSLVIAGSVLKFSDGLATYFMKQASPSNTNAAGFDGTFVDAITRGFSPAALFNAPDAPAGGAFDNFVQQLLNLVFIIVFLALIAFAFFALAVMLIIRFAWIAFLLILMPLALLLSIFPTFKSNYDKWLHHFVRWAFFPPLCIFFLYLAVMTTAANDPSNTWVQAHTKVVVSTTGQTNGSAAGALSSLNGRGEKNSSGLLSAATGMLIALALAYGSLFAANSLGIAGAGIAVNAANGAGAFVGKWGLRKGKQAVTSPLRGGWGQKLTRNLQGRRGPLKYLGRGLEAISVTGGERAVSAAKDRTKNMTLDQKVHNLGTADAPTRMAWLQEIKEAGRLKDIQNPERYFGADKKNEFARYGKGRMFDELRGESGLHLKELVDKRNAIEDGVGLSAEDKKAQLASVDTEIQKHFAAASNAGELADAFFQDFGKLRTKMGGKAGDKNLVLGLNEEGIEKMQAVIAKNMPKGFSPNSMSTFFQKLTRGDQMEQFVKVAHEQKITLDQISEQNKRWLEGSAAGNLGIGTDTFVPGAGRRTGGGERAGGGQPNTANPYDQSDID